MNEFYVDPDEPSDIDKFNMEILNNNIYVSTLENRTEEDLSRSIENIYSIVENKNKEILDFINLNVNHVYLTGYLDAIKCVLVSIRKNFILSKDIPDHLVLTKVIEIIKETGDRLVKNTTK